MSFSKKVVVVTGGCSGIGEATAIAFAKEGATVVIIDKDNSKGEDVTKKIKEFGQKPTVLYVDVCDDAAVKITADTIINLHGQLDVLVNCAGIIREATLLEKEFVNKFDEVINVNLRALVLMTHLMTPHIIKTKGNIINIASGAATSLPRIELLGYCVSKAGVHHFTKSAAKELGPLGVRVNSVSPGYVRTNLYNNCGLPNSINYDTVGSQTALGTVSEPSDIADLIVFLASEKAKCITGANYAIDCGFTLLR